VNYEPRVTHARPGGHIEHPMTHGRDFWLACFGSYGFREQAIPEEVLKVPNPFTLNSFNSILLVPWD